MKTTMMMDRGCVFKKQYYSKYKLKMSAINIFFSCIFFSFFFVGSALFQSSASSLSVPVTSTVSVKGFCSFPVCLCVSIMLTWLSYGNRNKDNLLLLSTSAFY